MTATQNEYVASLPMILGEVEVRAAERVAASFVRLELGGPLLADFGVDGPLRDQRIKLIFPNARGELPSFAGMEESWWSTWLQTPEAERGSVRSYTVTDVHGEGADTRLVVDIVVHEHHGDSGPGARWAMQATPGDRVILMGPRRGHTYGGIEWSPGTASRLLVVGDETAVPAVRGILRDLPADAVGAAFVEVPYDADVLPDLSAPARVSVTWLPRNGGPRGVALHAAVLAHLTGDVPSPAVLPLVTDDEVDPSLWETPVYSSAGDEVLGSTAVPETGTPHAGLYAWIAGEAKIVTGLRRKLVKDLGLDRGQVAFMGYWREGVAMRS